MIRLRTVLGLSLTLALAAGSPAAATGDRNYGGRGGDHSEPGFERIATFSVYRNNADPSQETVAEIIDATKDGRTLVYTDAAQEAIGFVDIANPSAPQPGGVLPMGGEPTSVGLTSRYALVAVNTSPSFIAPSGHLAVVDLATRTIVRTIPLAGQPDSIKVSPDQRYAAIAIENERDEDIEVGGAEGGLPQSPAGLLEIVDMRGAPAAWAVRDVDLTGLSSYAPDDPEPEFVDIDERNRAVVTMQENNHVAVVDLRRATVISDFDAGAVDLDRVDTTEDGVIDPSGSLSGVVREPDGVSWLPGGRIATANEGDLFGGSRGFTVFDTAGNVRFDSGNSVEQLAIRYGHYPEDRSENKGTEPEGVEYGRYGRDDMLFVGSERGNFVAVYELDRSGTPRFAQLLPTALGPEGLLAMPSRGLFVATSETDDPPFGVRTNISIYRRAKATYPDVVSADGPDGAALPWSALSGLAADPRDARTLYTVWDAAYAQSRILTLDVGQKPAVITTEQVITGGTGNYDPEGIALAPDGTKWIASEGNASDARPNRLLQVDGSGAVVSEIGLPQEILACRAASTNRGSLGSGFEGVTVVPRGQGYVLYVAQQRGWDYTTPECEALDDDPTGANAGEPGWTRVWIYDPVAGTWVYRAYELQPVPANAAWVGLSEIVWRGGDSFSLIERDNLSGDFTQLKTVTTVSLDDEVTRSEKQVLDILPALRATNGWVTDKPEGLTIARDGTMYVVTDNDGVDGWSGETQLLRLTRRR